MKRANGTGGVIKLGGNRRRPYVVRVTVGRSPEGKQLTKAVGYFATKDEATEALINYNKSPYDIDSKQITMAELYDKWKGRAIAQGRLAKSSIKTICCGYKHCADLYDIPYPQIRPHMMQACVDNCGLSYSTQQHIKSLFYHLDEYAMEFDIIVKRCSEFVRTSTIDPKPKTLFKNAEVYTLWENIDMPWVDTILILLYSGWRVSELLGLSKKNVSIDPSGKTVNYMQGGIKTKAGKDRIVPIHSLILPIVKKRYEECNTHLIENVGKPMRYELYLKHFKEIMTTLNMKHTTHETRHTFRSWLDRTPASISCVNRIMGHSCSDIGLKTYTIKTVEELRSTIELIKSIQ